MFQWKLRAMWAMRVGNPMIYRIALAALVLIVHSVLLANAQHRKGYPAHFYDLLDPWVLFGQQSLVPTQFETIRGNQTRFEPAKKLPSLDAITQPVGRLEIKRRWNDGTLDAMWCTAFLVSSNQALTNYHCIPGSPTQYTIAEARVRFNYLDQGQADTQAFSVKSYGDANEGLDFTVLNLEGTPGSTFGTVSLHVRDPRPEESLIIVHHPYSLPKRVTRFALQCKAAPATDLMPGNSLDFRHFCDTYGGSSGSPVFTDSGYNLVGLHYYGAPQGLGGEQAYNLAKRMVQILAASRTLTGLSTGTVWRNSIGMEFVLIPAGEFQMGSNDTEALSDEKPVHTVRLTKPFYLGKYEVTQAQWEAVMENNPSRYKGDSALPVEKVSWQDVQEFISRLNARERGTAFYRLPTEAEWEYAARAGSNRAYSFGNSAGDLGRYAWCDRNSGDKTHPVGQLQPNAWGLYDMHGNVWEWVQDWYEAYSGGTAVDPAGPSKGWLRVARGGSRDRTARDCRSAARIYGVPDVGYSDLGFRLLRMAQ